MITASMTLRLPDGRAFDYAHKFDDDTDPKVVEFMFMEGNYSCDCNLSGFLIDAGHDVPPMECGMSIEIEDFRVHSE